MSPVRDVRNRLGRLERQRAEAEQLGREILRFLATASPDEVAEIGQALRALRPPFGPAGPRIPAGDPSWQSWFESLPADRRAVEFRDLIDRASLVERALSGTEDD